MSLIWVKFNHSFAALRTCLGLKRIAAPFFLSEQLPRLLASRRLARSSFRRRRSKSGLDAEYGRRRHSRRYAINYFEAAAAIMGGGIGLRLHFYST